MCLKDNPIPSAAALTTAETDRAEIELPDGSRIRLDYDTHLEMARATGAGSGGAGRHLQVGVIVQTNPRSVRQFDLRAIGFGCGQGRGAGNRVLFEAHVPALLTDARSLGSPAMSTIAAQR